MAIVNIEYKSTALGRNTNFIAILPSDFTSDPEMPWKTLYFLPGFGASSQELATYLSFRKQSELKQLVVVLVNGENSFYVDHPERVCNFSTYIGREVVEVSRKLLPLSRKREDTFIGGISMGGYGAVYNGIKYRDTFSKVVSMSGSLDGDDLLCRHPESHFTPEMFNAFFYSHERYENSDMDLKRAIVGCGESLPELFFCCGEQDGLTGGPNREMDAFLRSRGLPHTFRWDSGDHDLDYWEGMMDPVFSFLVGIPEGSRNRLTLDIIR